MLGKRPVKSSFSGDVSYMSLIPTKMINRFENFNHAFSYVPRSFQELMAGISMSCYGV